jgi:hypothetical protein
MPPTDPRYEALRERFPDILPETDDDPALTRLVRDLDILMQAPAPTALRRVNILTQSHSASETASQTQPDAAPTPILYPSGTRRQRRFGALIATVAAALVVALLAGTLLTRMAGTPGQPGVARVHYSPAKGACAPGDITMHLPAHGAFGALDMVSPDEGWAVGAVVGDPATPQYGSAYTLILHYTHCAWKSVGAIFPGVGLSSVSMGSASDGWALGATTTNKPFALHYTNGSWLPVSPLPGASVLHGGSYSSVRMLSADEGWIIFNRAKDSSGYGTTGLLHLAHNQWSEVETPFPVAEVVLPVAPDEAWVAGSASSSQEQLVLYHYKAGMWMKVTAPTGITIYDMRMVTPTNIWASGQTERGSSREAGAVLHYDGSQWRQVPVGATGRPQDVEAFDQSTAWAFTRYEPSVTTGYTPPPLAFNSPTISTVQYQHDGVWSQVKWPFTNLTRIGQIIRVSSDEYWAIGYHRVTNWTPTGNGGYTGSGYAVPVLLYFANGVWHEYGAPTGG